MDALVTAATMVVDDAQGFSDQGDGSKEALEQNVSQFLQSLRRFPEPPLPFPVAVYRDFFVIVAQWRSNELEIDARHTIDLMRTWIESSTDTDRFVFDQMLIEHPGHLGGPIDLAGRLLSLLVVLHNDGELGIEACEKITSHLVDSLERAAEITGEYDEQRLHLIVLLGIVIDAWTELTGRGIAAIAAADLTSRQGRLFVDLIWRDEALMKIAAGILDRVCARRCKMGYSIAECITLAIIGDLEEELGDASSGTSSAGAGRLEPISQIFRCCLNMMVDTDEEETLQFIERVLLERLSSILCRMLDWSINDAWIAELDDTSTNLYESCVDVMQQRCT